MKKLKKLIFAFIIIIIIILIALLILNKDIDKDNNYIINNNILNNNENQENDLTYDTSANGGNQPIKDSNIKAVTNYTKFYTVSNCVQEYLDNANNKNKEVIYNILNDDYINENGIDAKNVLNYTDKLTKSYNFTALKMNVLEGINTDVYSVYGKILEEDETGIGEDIFFIVNICKKNMTFSITPLNNSVMSINNIKIKNNDTEIAKNDDNVFSYHRIKEEEIIKKYLAYFKKCMLYNQDEAYNLVNSEYINKRFGNKDEFKKYIEENKFYIYRAILSKYAIDSENKIYTAIDNYGNHYIFKETAVMQYTVYLDNYTIISEEELAYYNNLDKFDKSKYNLTKFVNMVNTKDYNAIYNVLNTTFRANNFATVDQLKSYLKNNMYDFNVIEIENYDDETYEYYVFNCKITNMQNNNESKNMTIIINQTEGTEFTMSFSF